MKYNSIIVRFSSEIGIKSKPVRKKYEKLILKRIEEVMKKSEINYTIEHKYGRVYIYTDEPEKVIQRITKIFGVGSVSPAIRTSAIPDDIIKASIALAEGIIKNKLTFKVACRRVGEHPYTSSDIINMVGDAILRKFYGKVKVDLKNPDVDINIEIREDRAYIYVSRLNGVGGLPLGVQGKLVCLLSTGLDSPVACWYAMKRGSEIIPIHFKLSPFISEKSIEIAKKLAEKLFEWAMGMKEKKMYIVHGHGEVLEEIMEKVPRRYICVFCKRMMLRVAEVIARRENAYGIVTGDILGEQASQTAENLMVISEAVSLPIYRPLFGFDKIDVEKMARNIGTYEISTSYVELCKAVPPKPTTKAKLSVILEYENKLDINNLVKKEIDSIEIIKIK